MSRTSSNTPFSSREPSSFDRPEFWLFGDPIQHSASPAFHNFIFSQMSLPDYHYELCETAYVDSNEMLTRLRSPRFGGASVTAPLKITVCRPGYLDRLTPECQACGSCNTIFTEKNANGEIELIGTNFDWVGIRNALRSAMDTVNRNTGEVNTKGPAFVIGGGGTCRSAIVALSTMGLSPIYLINRDDQEISAILNHFPDLELVPILNTQKCSSILSRMQQDGKRFVCGVGCIPCISPTTPNEKEVYLVAETIFKHARNLRTVFLDMAYKPRQTLLLTMAKQYGWISVEGIEAMIHQGFAQSRQWILHSATSPYPNEQETLPTNVEEQAAKSIREMKDIVVPPKSESVAPFVQVTSIPSIHHSGKL